MQRLVFALSLLLGSLLSAKTLQTNSVNVYNAPSWLTEKKLRSVATKIGNFLEWDFRRVKVYWHKDYATYLKVHKLGKGALAVTMRKDQTIHLGPKVNQKNFRAIFGHELAHVILMQKYKEAIPPWLEEGLANYAAQNTDVDYKYLARKPFKSFESFTHPFERGADTKYQYQASTALMNMIAEKCPIRDLLQLSVGKKIETYLRNFCKINDLNATFRTWVTSKAKK